MNKTLHSLSDIGLKLLLVCAPLLWAVLYGFLQRAPIPYAWEAMVVLVLVSVLLFKILESARKTYQATIFNFPLSLPPWFVFVGLTLAGLALLGLFPVVCNWPILTSLIWGVSFSPTFEELITRSLFVAFPLSAIEAIFLNLLSSCAFSSMHYGYHEIPKTLHQYLLIHFGFSFMLGLIAYKTKRIELCMLIHACSNFLRYTLPVLILGQEGCNPTISLIYECITLIILAGCSYRAIAGRLKN